MKPSPADMLIAAQWLYIYESASDGTEDTEACERVRLWLLEQSDKEELRQVCRAAGVSVKQAKQAITRRGAKS